MKKIMMVLMVLFSVACGENSQPVSDAGLLLTDSGTDSGISNSEIELHRRCEMIYSHLFTCQFGREPTNQEAVNFCNRDLASHIQQGQACINAQLNLRICQANLLDQYPLCSDLQSVEDMSGTVCRTELEQIYNNC